jgi:hypothetical protein
MGRSGGCRGIGTIAAQLRHFFKASVANTIVVHLPTYFFLPTHHSSERLNVFSPQCLLESLRKGGLGKKIASKVIIFITEVASI